MKFQATCYSLLAFLFFGFIACGNSDDDAVNQPAQTAPTPTLPTEPTGGEVVEVPQEPVDFAVEEAAITAMIVAHDAAATKRDFDGVIAHWLDTKDSMLAQGFFGVLKVNRTFNKVKKGWKTILAQKETLKSAIAKIGFDVRAQNATAIGTLTKGPNKWPFVLAFRKDTEGNWKYLAADYGNHNLIKEIITPK